MKYQVQAGKTGVKWTISLPSSLCLRRPGVQEKFLVQVSKDNVNWIEKEACFLADGRSLLVGTDVIRLGSTVHVKRNENYRMGIGKPMGNLTQRTLAAKIVRPVEPKKSASSAAGGDLKSPMTGKVLAISVSEGSRVQEGDVLVIIEAMKMENRIVSECAGTVRGIRAELGKAVSTGDLLMRVDPDAAV
jgi:biotin carboxyl carrier protein